MNVYSNALIKPERSLIITVINLSCLLLDNDNDKTRSHVGHGSAHLHTCLFARNLDDSQEWSHMHAHMYTHTPLS